MRSVDVARSVRHCVRWRGAVVAGFDGGCAQPLSDVGGRWVVQRRGRDRDERGASFRPDARFRPSGRRPSGRPSVRPGRRPS